VDISNQTALSAHAGQAFNLLEGTAGLGSRIDIPKLAGEMGADLAVLLPILGAAEMPGLVRIEDGAIFLTEEGLRSRGTIEDRVKMLRDKLPDIEPIRTAIELSSGNRGVTSRDVADSLAKRGIKWHHKPDLNESLVRTLLICWMIPARLLSYNGKSGRFQKV
jgi:hypothetical protein